ncbi:flavin reductase family [Pyrenophora seminiperda CCB06]|uniref:Flavin reductase family n=1 Tax=Pyrenophora seminiperda CCB06 TaxID=1302712 RepID=A0A3M7M807_9PLEO|nr:flavin reductase family [Pyrenophora seminiperda CCB06]
MSLSQRPAARFFAAFYRWNLHTQRSRPCAPASQCARNNAHVRHGIFIPRYYHATRLLQQSQDEQAATPTEDARAIPQIGEEQISQPAKSIPVQEAEEVAKTQPSVEEQDIFPEPSEAELKKQALKTSVRSFMRNVPSSVAVITVAGIDASKRHGPVGVAVSSLSTVTLDPPTISFNIKQPSKTLDAIRTANGLFRVHFPAADRGGAKVVDLFSQGNHLDAYSSRWKELKIHHPKKNTSSNATALSLMPSNATALSLAPQIWDDFILAAMECKVTHEFPVADHVILVARVESLEHKLSTDPTMLYIDGGYRVPKGEKIYSSVRARTPIGSDQAVWSVWDYPLFPGEKERLDYLAQVKAIVKKTPAYYKDPTKETYRELDSILPYPPASFGINTELLVAECRRELGLDDKLPPELKDQQVLADFYGSLTPSMREKIIERAKRAITLDPRFLTQNYRLFLQSIGVSPNSRDLLPSDIMQPLRAAGLVPPFDSRREQIESRSYDIRKVEQIEFHLREEMSKMKYAAALKEPFDKIIEAMGEKRPVVYVFKKARARLLTESHPTLFNNLCIDISGHLTEAEVRVVMCRLINSLDIFSMTFRRNITQDWCELLRRVGVNPTITGMNVEFMIGKLRHIFYSTRHFRDFPIAVEEMLKPWFVWTVSWDNLEERVKQFVQKTPLRATGWSSKDRLAAMGLHWEAVVTLPKVDSLGEEVKQPLWEGHILDTLVAKELKNYYGKGTDEENEGIAKYLKEAYDFDVTHKSIVYTPATSPDQSSGDDMQKAMEAYLPTQKGQVKSSFLQRVTGPPRPRTEVTAAPRKPRHRSSKDMATGKPPVRVITPQRTIPLVRRYRASDENKLTRVGKIVERAIKPPPVQWKTYTFSKGDDEGSS